MAIINVALGITAVMRSDDPWYIKAAQIVVLAAAGYAQIQAIRNANPGSETAQGTPVGTEPGYVAAPVVSRVRKLPAPLLPKIVLLAPPKTAPMSAPLPACRRTTRTRIMQAMMWMVVMRMIMVRDSY
jgi:hypothetical protein